MTDDPPQGNPACPGCGIDLTKCGIRMQVIRTGTAISSMENSALFVLTDEDQVIGTAHCAACGIKLTKKLKKLGIKVQCRSK